MAVDRASTAFIGTASHDSYSEPIQASSEWWAAVADIAVDEIMIWGGGGEILIDGIRAYAGTMAEGFAMADAGIQSARTSAAARRSTAAHHRSTSGLDESTMKEANLDEVVEQDAPVTPEQETKEEEVTQEVDVKAGEDVVREANLSEETDVDPDAVRVSAETGEPKGDFIVDVDVDDAATRRRFGTERVFYLETPRASHEEQIMNHTLRIKGKTPSATVIEDWIRSRI
jgi:hypothetical protein